MTALGSQIDISPRFARSANLERDITSTGPLGGYIVTARALDLVERLATTASTTSAGGAWSITGPYGSGKSSLAVLLDGVFGEIGPVREMALGLIQEVAPTVADTINQAHKRHGTTKTGFHRAVVTANREPISYTVLRALESAVLRRHGKVPTAAKFAAAPALKAALADAVSDDPRRSGPSPAALIEIARCLAQDSPLLIVIDEFGKNLEAIDESSSTDPYLLQQLAEAGQGAGQPIFTLTLQHLSFEDYFAGTDNAQQREWAKVQGRFEDVPYVDSPAQTRALIGTVFDTNQPALARQIREWATKAAKAMTRIGLPDLSDPDTVASCYPLHPVAAAVLPELCSRYGQNERTLFSFLTGPDPAAVPAFLARAEVNKNALPVIGLPEIYDYFVAGGVVGTAPGTYASRWTEIATRLRDAHGLTDEETALAKSIAVLNLVSSSGTLRASDEILKLVHSKPTPSLKRLAAASLITYRDFADEYRVWQGSDINLRAHIDAAQKRNAKNDLVDVLNSVAEPKPVVAARHSAVYDILRIFSRRYFAGTEPVEPVSALAEIDGEILLVVDSAGRIPTKKPTSGPTKPTVAAVPNNVDRLDEAARSVAAIHSVLSLPEVEEDWVARAELAEQLAQAESALNSALVDTFIASNCEWFLLHCDAEPRLLPSGRGTAAISAAADIAYPDTPIIGNEMINRSDVTSQGSKARRLVLEGMIERLDEVDLGFTGYGPEVAMYRSVLDRTGMHRIDRSNNSHTIIAPEAESLQPAWLAMEGEFERASKRKINLNDVYSVLMSPPIGMKAAVLPIFVTAGLLAHADEVAIYEHGTFRPVLSAEVSERMVRNPNHFDIKHFANASGARRHVVDELADTLGVQKRFRKHRVSNVLAIVGHLVGAYSGLDNYTRKTSNLSAEAIALRDALETAVEPDELLFEVIPQALGLPKVGGSAESYSKRDLLAAAVAKAMTELNNTADHLLEELAAEILEHAGETSRLALTGQAASLENEILDPDARSFIMTVANDAVDSSDQWIKAIATVVSQKAVAEWSDEDLTRYRVTVPTHIAAFYRLMALHADNRAEGLGAFASRRVTFTTSDGRENHRLVSFDESDRPAVEAAMQDAIEALAVALGSPTKAQHALLAILGEQVLPIVSPDIQTVSPNTDVSPN